MHTEIRVALVGGGIGGLCLAAGLARLSHIKVTVYEAVPEYKDVGAGLALHMNAIKAMQLISPCVKQAYFDAALTMAEEAEQEMSTQVTIASGQHTGAVVAELGRAKGRKTVARADLLAGLLKLVPNGGVVFGKKLVSIEEVEGQADHTVRLTFRDGTYATADCIIGCDGVHSLVRQYLLGADHPATLPQNHDGWQVYRTLIPSEEAKKYIDEKWTRTVPIMCGPKGHINCMPLHRGKHVSAGVAVRGARQPGMTGTPPLRVDDFAGYTKDAQEIVKMISLDTSASWAVSDHDHAPYYHRRNVCIMGDAAHAALPFAGNGAAQAIEDAAVLNALFAAATGPSQVGAAFEAYDVVRRPRSQRAVEIARDFGRLYGFALPECGDDPAKMRAYFGKCASFTNDADLNAQNADALGLFRYLLGGEHAAGPAREQSPEDGLTHAREVGHVSAVMAT